MIKEDGKIIEVLNEFLNGFTWKDTRQMPAVVCYLHIILLDFKVRIAEGLSQPWRFKINSFPSQMVLILDTQPTPALPFSIIKDNMEEKDYASLSCCGNYWKYCGVSLRLEGGFWKWATHLGGVLNPWNCTTSQSK